MVYSCAMVVYDASDATKAEINADLFTIVFFFLVGNNDLDISIFICSENY